MLILSECSCRDYLCDLAGSNVGLFLPRFTDTLESTLAAGLLSAFNFSQVIAQIVWGYLTDVSPAIVTQFVL
jgi:hypothetical protein